MFRAGYFFVRLIVALLVFGLLIAGGVALYNAGQAQGYALGVAAASSGEGTNLLPAAPGYYYPYMLPRFGFYGPLLCILPILGLLVFLSFGFFFRPRHPMRRAGGPWAGKYWHMHPYGPYPGSPEAPESESPPESSPPPQNTAA